MGTGREGRGKGRKGSPPTFITKFTPLPETGDAVKFNLFTVTVARTSYASRGVAVHWPGIAEFRLTCNRAMTEQ